MIRGTRRHKTASDGPIRSRLRIEYLEARETPAVSAVGPEFRVNTVTANLQDNAVVASDADGDFVVAWSSRGQDGDSASDSNIYAQRYDRNGGALGGAFLVNTFTTGIQSVPSIGVDADGDFIVAWLSVGQDGDGAGLFAQRFRADGSPVGLEFQVNTFTTGGQQVPRVTMDADGDCVIVWQSNNQDGSGYGIFAQRYSSAGTQLGPEFRVNTFAFGAQSSPTVAATLNGGFVVAWVSLNQDGSGDGVFARRYDAAGVAQGTEFLVNTFTTGDQQTPSVAVDGAGNFVVAWESINQASATSGYDIYAQRFDAAGAPLGGEILVTSSFTGDQKFPSAARAAAGQFVVAYTNLSTSGSLNNVRARVYDAQGVQLGSEINVNSYTTGNQGFVKVASDAEGDLVAIWAGEGTSDLGGIFAQRFDESTDTASPLVTGVFSPETVGPVVENERLGTTPSALVVAFSEDMAVTGGAGGANSVTNPANWTLQRNGTSISAQITGITFGFNNSTRRHEAVLSLASPLGDGQYVLTASTALRDLASNGIDGDSNGTPGGTFSRTFRVGVPAAIGPEFPINQLTTGSQSGAAMAMDAAGNSVITWRDSGADGSNSGVYGRRYNAQGAALGTEFRVNTFTTGNQQTQDVAMDSVGNFIVAWQSTAQDGDGYGVYAQRYSAAGAPLGGEFRVNTTTTLGQGNPSVAIDAAGNFVIAWSDISPGNSDIMFQRYAADGTPRGGESRVNTFTTGTQNSPCVAMAASGAFVVSWSSGQQFGVYARRFSAHGEPLDSQDQRVSSPATATSQQRAASVAADTDGNFVVTWETLGQDGNGYAVFARRYNAAGTALGNEFLVNQFSVGDQEQPCIAMDLDGDFVITWQSDGQDGNANGVYARRYSGLGVAQGNEFRVNTFTTNNQSGSDVVTDADGDFLVAWQSLNQDGNLYGVYAQRFGVTAPPQVNSVQVNDGTAQRSRVTSLTVTFDATVAFAGAVANAFTLTRTGGGPVNFTASASVISGVTVVTLNAFNGAETESSSLRDGRYTLTVVANQVSANGTIMTSNFSFGDAQGLFRFYGDMNGDRRVDISDFGFFSLAYLTQANYNAALDFNNDGRIDIADFGQFSVRYFTTLP